MKKNIIYLGLVGPDGVSKKGFSTFICLVRSSQKMLFFLVFVGPNVVSKMLFIQVL